MNKLRKIICNALDLILAFVLIFDGEEYDETLKQYPPRPMKIDLSQTRARDIFRSIAQYAIACCVVMG